jgi:ABC-type transport system involved in multi-copper enzyme maturation permease subunit
MNLWTMELIHLFRSWRGWSLLGSFILASVLSLVIGIFIERANVHFSLAEALEIYLISSIVGTLLFVGIVVSSLAFDGNKDSSIFLRTRFSMKQILLTKVLVYFPLSTIFFFLGFFLTLIVGLLIFDSSDTLSLNWFLWGTFLSLVSNLFYVALMLFTSSIFRGSVASVLLTLAVLIGIPLIGGTVITVELLMRGLIQTPPAQWETVSYVARMLLWWPAALSDTQAFLSVTESEIRTGTITYFGQSSELDPHFRYKSFISALVVSPLFALFAWRRYTSREM